MATVTAPSGKTFEETQPVALAYYEREEGYTVDAGKQSVSTVKVKPPVDLTLPDPPLPE